MGSRFWFAVAANKNKMIFFKSSKHTRLNEKEDKLYGCLAELLWLIDSFLVMCTRAIMVEILKVAISNNLFSANPPILQFCPKPFDIVT